MARLNLEASTDNQKIVLAYLEENASDDLAERINNGNKTMADCWSFVTKMARQKAVNNCACIEDKEVFGWAIHFFEEDGITVKAAEAVKPPVKVEKKEEKKPVQEEHSPAPPKKTKKTYDCEGQLDMFGLLGGM